MVEEPETGGAQSSVVEVLDVDVVSFLCLFMDDAKKCWRAGRGISRPGLLGKYVRWAMRLKLSTSERVSAGERYKPALSSLALSQAFQKLMTGAGIPSSTQ